MMKKMAMAGMAMLMCLSLGTAAYAEENENILEKISEVNQFDNYLTTHENMLISYQYMQEEAWEEQIYFTDKCFVHTAPDWSFYWVDDQAYGYDSDSGYYVILCMDGAEESVEETYQAIPYYVYEKTDELLGVTEEDGSLIVELKSEIPLEDDEIENQKIVLTVDAETYEIQKIEVSMLTEDEENIFFIASTEFDTEYIPDPEVFKAALGEGDNVRTMQLIADPGMENEKTYDMIAAKDARINVFFAEGYEEIYDDTECTKKHELSEELPKELTVYTRKTAE